MKKVEKKVAETVLQDAQSIKIGKDTYKVASPTIATLVRVSGIVSEIPEIGDIQGKEPQVALKQAKYWGAISKSLAIMIIGEKKGFIAKLINEYRIKKLTETLNNMEIEVIVSAYIELLAMMKLEVFFSLITFLQSQSNLTKPTRTTASGALSEVS